jgi:hypothetical protein
MRAPILPVASLIVSLVAACSNPPVTADVQTDDSFSSELELAIFAASGGDASSTQVVSDLEIRRPGPPAASPVSAAEEPRRAARVEPEPAVALAMLGEPVYSTPPLPEVETVTPVAVGGGSDHHGHAGPVTGRPGGGRGGVIIRGGVDGRDPCAIHFPGILSGSGGDLLGAIGVLINNPAPRHIGPSAPRGPSRRGSMIPRGGGGMLAGGIR